MSLPSGDVKNSKVMKVNNWESEEPERMTDIIKVTSNQDRSKTKVITVECFQLQGTSVHVCVFGSIYIFGYPY